MMSRSSFVSPPLVADGVDQVQIGEDDLAGVEDVEGMVCGCCCCCFLLFLRVKRGLWWMMGNAGSGSVVRVVVSRAGKWLKFNIIIDVNRI